MDIDLRAESENDDSEHSMDTADEDEETRKITESAEIQSHLHGDDLGVPNDNNIMMLHQGDDEEQNNLNSIINEGADNGDQIDGMDDNNSGMDFTNANDNNGEQGSEEQNGENNQGEEDEEDEEDDDDDDDVQITIGDFSKSTSSTGMINSFGISNINLNLNKSGRQFGQSGVSTGTTVAGGASSKTNKSSLDLDSVGTFNGLPIYDLNLDTLEDKPWRKPGADITDYFNYGFNEESWKVYCERQRKIRSMNAANQFDTNSVLNMNSMQLKLEPIRDPNTLVPPTMVLKNSLVDQPIPIASVNENSKYNSSGSIVINTNKKAGPPPGRKTSGSIDVIGSSVPSGVIPPPPVLTPLPNRPILQPPPSIGVSSGPPSNSSTPTPITTQGSEQNIKENFISVIGNRTGNNQGGPPGLPFLPPMSMPPPFGFPPPPHDLPPGIRHPMGILPPPIQLNGHPLPFGPPGGGDGFPMRQFAPPGGGMLPHPVDQRPFDDDNFHDGRRRMSPKFDREPHHPREQFSSSSTTRSRSFREYEDSRSSRHSYRGERDYHERSRDRSRERSRDKEYETSSSSSSIRRHRSDRDRKEKEKERDHREKDHHRDKESSSSKSKSSSSKHDSSNTSSSNDHKSRHSSSSSSKSKSKRDKSPRERDSRSSTSKDTSSRKDDDTK